MPHPSLRLRVLAFATSVAASVAAPAAAQDPPRLDERPRQVGEWGHRPVDGSTTDCNPPAFVWRPHPGAIQYEWEAARSESFTVGRRKEDVVLPVVVPSAALAEGTWYWRYRCTTAAGTSPWSRVRTFQIAPGTPVFVMPDRDTLRSRLPAAHPRLFLRPEDVPVLRARLRLPPGVPGVPGVPAAPAAPGAPGAPGTAPEVADRALIAAFAALAQRCEALHAAPPATAEPPLYPENTARGSEAWKAIWWGNRKHTIAVLSAAADLAFVAHLAGTERHAQLARRLLTDVAKWDPRGSTGYRYNDEAGMPYAYWFARSYTFLHGVLSATERKKCQDVMQVRGAEMYAHLAPRHLFRPYNSHANRAWHFLGEVGIAFHGEIAAAEDWVWFASRVFGAVYPVWSDVDGGWHEGLAYWNSYLGRFTWWADVQKAAYGTDAYQKPFFAHAGDFALYLQPPGTVGGGFGDLTARRRSAGTAPLMRQLAQGAQNGYWAWHAAQAPAQAEPGFIGVLRSAREPVAGKPPADLPASKLFRGTGVAVMNRTLLGAADNVQVIFKSSPFGTQSHGYEAQNSFLLYAFGERLLIRSGRRDAYGSAHHRKWMWSTRSTNSITVGGKGQPPHAAATTGAITMFHAGEDFDYAVGEAGTAYPDLDVFTRRILFAKPDYIVIHDTLVAKQPQTFQWWLHAQDPVELGSGSARVVHGKAACIVKWLVPDALQLAQTDRFDPPPRPRVKLTEHHVTASTATPNKEMTFVTVIRPYRSENKGVDLAAKVEAIAGGYRVRIDDALVVELHGKRTTATWGERTFDSAAADRQQPK